MWAGGLGLFVSYFSASYFALPAEGEGLKKWAHLSQQPNNVWKAAVITGNDRHRGQTDSDPRDLSALSIYLSPAARQDVRQTQKGSDEAEVSSDREIQHLTLNLSDSLKNFIMLKTKKNQTGNCPGGEMLYKILRNEGFDGSHVMRGWEVKLGESFEMLILLSFGLKQIVSVNPWTSWSQKACRHLNCPPMILHMHVCASYRKVSQWYNDTAQLP